MTMTNKKSTQEWIVNLIQKHKHKNMIFSLSFNNDNIKVYGDLCPDVPIINDIQGVM